jgi:DNA-binding transcriptional MocR family regulator
LESIKQLIRTKMKTEKTEQRITLFSRKELRDKTGWSHTQIRRHLERLIELEYISTRGGRNGVQIKYELLIDPKADRTGYLVGLIDLESLRRKSA